MTHFPYAVGTSVQIYSVSTAEAHLTGEQVLLKPLAGQKPHCLFFFFSSTTLLLPTHLPPPSCTYAQSCNPMDWLQSARLLCPWTFPGKNTGVGCISFSRTAFWWRPQESFTELLGHFSNTPWDFLETNMKSVCEPTGMSPWNLNYCYWCYSPLGFLNWWYLRKFKCAATLKLPC